MANLNHIKGRQTIKTQFKGSVVFSEENGVFLRISLNELTLRQLVTFFKQGKLKKKTLSVGVPSKSDKSVRNLKYFPLAKQLSRIIKIKKNISHSPVQVKQWSDEIRKLCELNNISVDRVENVLDWYAQNIGGEYIPIIESGYSLRMKFLRLEEASKRSEIKKNSGKPKVRFIDGDPWTLDEKTGRYFNKQGVILHE